MPADHPFIFAPGSFVGFCVQGQIFVDQMCESFFRTQRRALRVALADRALAARDLGFVLERFRASFHDTEVRELTKRIATGAAVDPSLYIAAGLSKAKQNRVRQLESFRVERDRWEAGCDAPKYAEQNPDGRRSRRAAASSD